MLAATTGHVLAIRLLWANCYWPGRILGTLAVLLGAVPGWIFLLASWLDPNLARHPVVYGSWVYVFAVLVGLGALSLLGHRRTDRRVRSRITD